MPGGGPRAGRGGGDNGIAMTAVGAANAAIWGCVNYCASKAALIMPTNSSALPSHQRQAVIGDATAFFVYAEGVGVRRRPASHRRAASAQ